jgi:cytochrome oxidase assembly protein ShyY1
MLAFLLYRNDCRIILVERGFVRLGSFTPYRPLPLPVSSDNN